MKRRALVCLIALSIAAGMLAGCGVQTETVGTTGDGSAATPLIAATVMTNANGAFNITGDQHCNSVPVNGTCTLSVTNTPSTVGANSAYIQIVSNASNTPTTIQQSS